MTSWLQVGPEPVPETAPLPDWPLVSVADAGAEGPLGAITGAELLPEEGAAGGTYGIAGG